MRTLSGLESLELRMTLETTVDRVGLANVLAALQTICGLKAAHVAETWQDTALAKAWERAEKGVGTAAEGIRRYCGDL